MMKTKLFFIACIFSLTEISAQEQKKDFEYYNSRMDRLVSEYSTEERKRAEVIKLSFWKADLSFDERKQIVYKIRKLFEQDKYTNLYLLGHEFLRIMWYAENDTLDVKRPSLEIKQMLMELNLQYYFYPGRRNIISGLYYHPEEKKIYTPKARKRMVEILENKKTGEEYEIFLKYYRSIPFAYVTASWEYAARLMKKRGIRDTSVLKQLRDSLLNDYIVKDAKQDFEDLQASPELIQMTGYLEMKECIPVLKQQLAYCTENECPDGNWAYRYALARMGDVEQRQYIWNNLILIEKFSPFDFAYFRDDGLIWHFISVNYGSGKRIWVMSDTYLGADLLTMDGVYPYIENVPEELRYSTDVRPMSEEYAWAKSLYEWLMANKEKVKFDYESEKKWYWYSAGFGY
jgi:hypothetical protein